VRSRPSAGAHRSGKTTLATSLLMSLDASHRAVVESLIVQSVVAHTRALLRTVSDFKEAKESKELAATLEKLAEHVAEPAAGAQP
jgi:hypothetical protein